MSLSLLSSLALPAVKPRDSPRESEEPVRARPRARVHLSTCPANAPAALFFSADVSYKSCNDESHGQSLWLVFSFCYYLRRSFCISFFFFLLYSFFFSSLLTAFCAAWNAFMPIQCIFLPAPTLSVRLSGRTATFCVKATNVCLRKPFRAF